MAMLNAIDFYLGSSGTLPPTTLPPPTLPPTNPGRQVDLRSNADATDQHVTDRPSADLLIVANRLPVAYCPESGWSMAPGGLVTALRPVVTQRQALWIGTLDEPVSTPPVGDMAMAAVPVHEVDPQQDHRAFSNRTLWPALHGMNERVEQRDSWHRGYQRVNELVADFVASRAPRGATVWIHDYHFLELPRLLRRLRSDVRIGMYLHVPVARPDVFESFADGTTVLRGLADADMIATQRECDARNLDVALQSVCGQSRPESIAVPVSIDVDDVSALANRPDIVDRAELIRAAAGRRILLGVDRLDYTKGVVNRLRAFEQLLRSGRVDVDDVTFIQIAAPTRTEVPAYRLLSAEVRALVADINTRYRSPSGSAVTLVERSVPFPGVVAHYLAADVAVVTPVRDGMNLVAKEFVTARRGDDAMLVLGRGAGTADELGSNLAVLVEGDDVDDVARGMEEALAMPSTERRTRMDAAAAIVADHDAHRWARQVVDRLESTPVLEPSRS